jgi:glutamate/tyrosine decarboxylase-like PLP-dependent enzyme
MNKELTFDRQNMEALLDKASEVAQRYFSRQADLPPGRHVPTIPTANLPEKGMGGEAVLRRFETDLAPLMCNSAGPRYFGLVTGGSTPASVAGDWLTSSFDQNACGSNDSAAPLIEHQTINMLRQLVGIDPAFFGTFVTGATMSNMVGLAQGRQWVGELLGVDVSSDGLSSLPAVRVFSGSPHSTVLKALAMIGIGRNSVTRVRTLPDREALDIAALEEHLASSEHPSIVVANAGTVNTVDFDDLVTISALRKKYKFWLHVDAAFGGFAGASKKYEHLVKGINEADSITIDAHKWLNVPYDSAMQFTRHKHLQLKIFQNSSAAYLTDPARSEDFFHYTPETSRRFRALPAWFSMMSYGREGHRSIVERCCELAQQLGAWIASSDAYTLLSPVRMNVVCFTFAGETTTTDRIKSFVDKVRDDGRVYFTPTVYAGRPAVRAAFSNWLTSEDDVAVAVSVLREFAPQKSSSVSEHSNVDQIL